MSIFTCCHFFCRLGCKNFQPPVQRFMSLNIDLASHDCARSIVSLKPVPVRLPDNSISGSLLTCPTLKHLMIYEKNPKLCLIMTDNYPIDYISMKV